MEILWLILRALVKNCEERLQWQILKMLLTAKAQQEPGEPQFDIRLIEIIP